jgi:hypothetical protein
VTSGSAKTVDGMAVAAVAVSGAGGYDARASIGAISSQALRVTVQKAGASPPPVQPAAAAESSGGRGRLFFTLAAGLPPAALAAIPLGGGAYPLRRRRAPSPALEFATAEAVAAEPIAVGAGAAATGVPVAPPEPPVPPARALDLDARRLYVHGVEAKPGLSNEQFRLLSYLYERRGKVVAREELVMHVWPDAHAEGVSEEALDALVRRVRERIAQNGGQRGYIATLRGQGFRLEV